MSQNFFVRKFMYAMHGHRWFKRYNWIQFLRKFTYRKRRKLANQIPVDQENKFTIPYKDGFYHWKPKNFPLINEVVSSARKIFEENREKINKVIQELESGATPDGFKTNPFVDLDISKHLSLDSPFIKFALHPAVTKAVAEYLGMVPILSHILLFYSPNKKTFPISSQYFHLDMHERKCMKIFIYIEDVDENTGPLTVIKASASRLIEKKLKYKNHYVHNSGEKTSRVDDDIIEKIVSKDDIVPLIGKSGSMFFADTDRCFHYGSRAATKPRLVMQFYYETPYPFPYPLDFSNSKFFMTSNLAKQTTNRIEKLILGAD